MPRYAQAKENVRVSRREVPQEALAEAERLNAELNGVGPRARPRVGHGAAHPRPRRGRNGGESPAILC